MSIVNNTKILFTIDYVCTVSIGSQLLCTKLLLSRLFFLVALQEDKKSFFSKHGAYECFVSFVSMC